MAPQEAEKILHRFAKTISDEFAINHHTKVVVGVSGGMDSMVLLFLLFHLGIPVVAAHVNYQLRGSDSDDEEKLVESFCSKHQIPFYKKRVEKSVWDNLNLQDNARKIRYEFYEYVLEQTKADRIATAHHAGDQVETMVLHWLRGDFPLVPSGMSATYGKVFRPLLHFSKKEIEWIADGFVVPWRMDASNLKNEYARNKVRNQMLPLMRDVQPGIEDMMLHQHQKNVMLHHYVMTHLSEECKPFFKLTEDVIIVQADIVQEDGFDVLRMAYTASTFGWSFEKGDVFLQLMTGAVGRKYEDKKGTVIREREGLRIHYTSEIPPQDVSLICEDVPVPHTFLPDNDSVVLDKSELIFPLVMRRWQHGDSFVPLGMKGRKKISDFLIQEKVELSDKENVFVVVSGKEICWVVGHRIGDKFKVTSQTTKAVRLSIK